MATDAMYRRIMAGDAGVWAAPLRGLLRLGEAAYTVGINARNRRYDNNGPVTTLDVPVISVGNITVGGTGKTPLVIELVRRLGAVGKSPAVVARGYGSEVGETGDEQRLIRRHCPDVAYVADADRIAGAQHAVAAFGADVIVLDDGFQHRRLGRKLDIVLIDATCPFGYGHVLPRGLLREPVTALRRAGLVVITRCDQASPVSLQETQRKLERLVDGAAIIRCRHDAVGIEDLHGHDLTKSVAGQRAVLFAAIGNPASFAHTCLSLGVEVVGHRWWPDHHRYTQRDVNTLTRVGKFPPHDILLTTEKDAVKLSQLPALDHTGIGVVKVAIDFVDDGGTILESKLEGVLGVS